MHHMRTHIKISCPICQAMFTRYNQLRDHVKQHSPTDRFKCHVCARVYASRESLYKHKKISHIVKKVQCAICNKIVRNKTVLRQHLHSHNHMKIPCSICGIMHSKTSMWKHKKMSHASRESLMSCKVRLCQKKFTNAEELNEHQEIHIAPGRFRCPQCNHEAINLRDLKSHMRKISHRTGSKTN